MTSKLLKRLGAGLLAGAMAVGMAASAWALDKDDPTKWDPITADSSITITGTNTSHTYGAYQIFKGELDERQKSVTVDGTNYPEFSYNVTNNDGTTAVVHVFRKDGKDYLVSATGTEFVASNYKEVSAAEIIKEQSLRNLTFGKGLSDAGVVYLAETNAKTKLDKTTLDKIYGADISDTVAAKAAALRANKDAANLIADKIKELVNEADIMALADELGSNGRLTTVAANITTATGNASGTATLAVKEHGYYMVKDNGGVDTENPDAKTRFMLRVAGTVTVAAKSSVPTVIKKVKENGTIHPTTMSKEDTKIPGYELPDGWNDVADYNIGDDVPFMLVGTLPSTYAGYHHYKYDFEDTLSAGLTFKQNSLKVYYANGDTKTEIKTGYTLIVRSGKVYVSIADLKSYKDEHNANVINASTKIIVEYSATLNEKANVGSSGNKNTVKLYFSNDPNYKGTGTTNDKPFNPPPFEPNTPDNPNNDQPKDDPNKDDDTPKSETPEDHVIVFTYKLDATKIAQQKSGDSEQTLAGAKFTLQRADNKYYSKDANGKITWVGDKTDNCVVTTTGDGKFEFKGLDKGTYTLTEVEAPSGYNQLTSPITFEIKSDMDNTQNWDGTTDIWTGKKLEIELTGTHTTDVVERPDTNGIGDAATGTVKLKVKNKSGSQLPVTGGMGTTLLYVFGGLMVVGAGVLLVSKKRMASK